MSEKGINRKYTIQDVANIAGVSKATVSRYINGKYDIVAEDKRIRIQNVIEKLGFRPNTLAQGLATNSLKEIGVSIADISNPFSSIMIKGIFDEARKWDYGVNFFNADNNPEEEVMGIQNFMNKNIQNFVINTTGGNDDFLSSLKDYNLTLVDRQMDKLMYDTVTSDNYESVFEAIQYMKRKKYENIIFLTEPLQNISTRIERFKAYKHAMEQHNSEVIIVNPEDSEELKNTIIEYSNRPEKLGFFAVNGIALLRTLNVVKDLKDNILTDIGLISFEDWDWMKVVTPEISAVRQDSYGLGVYAARMLLNRVENQIHHREKEPPELIKLSSQLIIRGSL